MLLFLLVELHNYENSVIDLSIMWLYICTVVQPMWNVKLLARVGALTYV